MGHIGLRLLQLRNVLYKYERSKQFCPDAPLFTNKDKADDFLV